MRKVYVVVLALLTTFAVGALMVASASAAELLAAGAKITEELPLQVSGEFLLEDDKASVLGNPDVLTSWIPDWVWPPGRWEFLLMLNGTLLTPAGAVGTPTDGERDMIEGTDMTSLCSKGEAEKVKVVFLNLPWDVNIELETIGGKDTYLLSELRETSKDPAYEVTCETSIGSLKDTCEVEEGTKSSALLENASEGLLVEFRESGENGITAPLECSLGGAKTGLISGGGIITETGSAKAAITVSE